MPAYIIVANIDNDQPNDVIEAVRSWANDPEAAIWESVSDFVADPTNAEAFVAEQKRRSLSPTPTSDADAIRQVVNGIVAAGWVLNHVNDGEEEIPVATADEVVAAVTAVDEASLFVNEGTKTGQGGWVDFVLGNEPYEVVCDYTINLDAAIEAVTDTWED